MSIFLQSLFWRQFISNLWIDLSVRLPNLYPISPFSVIHGISQSVRLHNPVVIQWLNRLANLLSWRLGLALSKELIGVCINRKNLWIGWKSQFSSSLTELGTSARPHLRTSTRGAVQRLRNAESFQRCGSNRCGQAKFRVRTSAPEISKVNEAKRQTFRGITCVRFGGLLANFRVKATSNLKAYRYLK